jgi:hypothetical protein
MCSIPDPNGGETVCGEPSEGTTCSYRGNQMRDLLAGITPIAAGFALAVIIHRSARGKQAI